MGELLRRRFAIPGLGLSVPESMRVRHAGFTSIEALRAATDADLERAGLDPDTIANVRRAIAKAEATR